MNVPPPNHEPHVSGPLPQDLQPTFDSSGLFAGETGEHIWRIFLADLEERLNEKGWDEPSRLFAVLNPVDTEADLGSDAIDKVRTELAQRVGRPHSTSQSRPSSLNTDGVILSVVELGEVHNHPVPQLWGFTAPPWVSALLLANEGWVVLPKKGPDGEPLPDPYNYLPNSQHPDRQELRTIMMVTRDGAQYSIGRLRGSQPETQAHSRGIILEVLMRALGLPTDPPEHTVGDFLGRGALTACIRVLQPLVGEPGTPHPNLPAEKIEEMRGVLSDMTFDARQHLLEGIFATTLVSTTAVIAWHASRHGELIAKPFRRALRDIAKHQKREPENFLALQSAARAAANLTFNDLAQIKDMAPVIPADVMKARAGWADEGLLSRRLCQREMATQEELLDDLKVLVGNVPAEAYALLEELGWLTPGLHSDG